MCNFGKQTNLHRTDQKKCGNPYEDFAQARNRHPELSAVAKHATEGHQVGRKTKILEVTDKTRMRRIKEALVNQRKDKNGKITLNRDKGVELSNMWLDLG